MKIAQFSLPGKGASPCWAPSPFVPLPFQHPLDARGAVHRDSWGMWLGLGPRGTLQRATKAKTPSGWCNDSPQTEHCGGYSELRLGFYVS